MSAVVTLTKSQVPNYLVGSEFYKNLSADDDDEFCIPQEYYKPTLSVANAEELNHLFHTMKFWGLSKLPHKVIEILVIDPKAVLSDKHESVNKVLLEFDTEFGLHTLYQALSECTSEEESLGVAINCGREDILEYLYLFHPMTDQFKLALLKAVAENGYINLLERVTDALLQSVKNPFKSVSVTTVAGRGYTECLRFLLDKGCGKQKDTCRLAAANGHLPCLKLAHEHGCSFNKKVRNAAAYNGHLDCLKYTLEHGCPVDADVACEAAQGGQLECLQYLIDLGVKITKRTYQSAVIGGNVECLKFLCSRGAATWDISCTRTAAKEGRLSCLQYLLDGGCKVDRTVTEAAAESGQNRCLELLLERKCAVGSESVIRAAENGHMECLHILNRFNVSFDKSVEEYVQMWRFYGNGGLIFVRSLFEAGYPLPRSCIESAVKSGTVECVEFICVKKLCTLTENLTVEAATCFRNRLPMLKILHQYQCPWGGTETCQELARQRDLESLTFAHEHGCPWDEQTVSAAIQRDGQACFHYALKNGCPISENACELAAGRGMIDMLKCLHERGCTLTLKTCVVAALNKYTDCLTYAVTHGAPVDATVCSAAATYVGRYGSGNTVENQTALQVLQCAHKLGCPWDKQTCAAAAVHPPGDNNCLQFAYEHGCPWDASTVTAAAQAGQMENLAFAMQNDCPFTVDACIAAAERGHLSALQLLRAYQCPWDERVSRAVAGWRRDVLVYCVENGCPIDAATMARYNTLQAMQAVDL